MATNIDTPDKYRYVPTESYNQRIVPFFQPQTRQTWINTALDTNPAAYNVQPTAGGGGIVTQQDPVATTPPIVKPARNVWEWLNPADRLIGYKHSGSGVLSPVSNSNEFSFLGFTGIIAIILFMEMLKR